MKKNINVSVTVKTTTNGSTNLKVDGFKKAVYLSPAMASSCTIRRLLLTGNKVTADEWYFLTSLQNYMFDDLEPVIFCNAEQAISKTKLYSVRLAPDTQGGWVMDVTRNSSGVIRRTRISADEFRSVAKADLQGYLDRVFCATVQEIRNGVGDDGSVYPGDERSVFGVSQTTNAPAVEDVKPEPRILKPASPFSMIEID